MEYGSSWVIGRIRQNRNHLSFVESIPTQFYLPGYDLRRERGGELTVIPFARVFVPALGATWAGFGADASDT